MLPYQEQLNYDETMPEFRLIDGPSVRQGRLQMKFRDRWRSVCTMVTKFVHSFRLTLISILAGQVLTLVLLAVLWATVMEVRNSILSCLTC